MFTLHQINAFEDNGFLIMDMCCGDNGEIIADFTLENLRRESGEEMDKVNSFSWLSTAVFILGWEAFLNTSINTPTFYFLTLRNMNMKYATVKISEDFAILFVRPVLNHQGHLIFLSKKSSVS